MNKHKILIIDDEQVNLELFDVMLSRLGFTVFLAEDGEEGLRHIKEKNPDIIILDPVLPRLTGWELTRMLKHDPDYSWYSDIPVIMFSAIDNVKDRIEGFEMGIEDYITKPFNFSEVLARIKAVLKGRELSLQVVDHEKKIALRDSLTKSFQYFTDHLRIPVEELLGKADTLEDGDLSQVQEFRELVVRECRQVLAALDGLKDELAEIKSKDSVLKDGSIDLKDMDQKFHQRFRELIEQENYTS